MISEIPFEDYGGAGTALHFAHANGYPPGAYAPLLERLSAEYRVYAVHMRPLWPGESPEDLEDCGILAADLAHFLENSRLNRAIGMGHSSGATATLRLALRQPDRFRALVLIDPVFFPPWMIVSWELFYRLGLAERFHPLVKGALRRREVFDNKQAMYANYRAKPIFQHIDDHGLQAYVDAMASPRPDGQVELAYPRQWEARIYLTFIRGDLPLWRALPALKPPLLLIRGANTNTFWPSTARRVQRALPNAHIHTIPHSTHLVPLERPNEVYEVTKRFLESTNLR